MPAPPPAPATVTDHPGSSAAAIAAEPDWGGAGHQHRVGFVNRVGRRAGLTHDGDQHYGETEAEEDERRFVADARRKYRELRTRREEGGLVDFADVMRAQTVSICFDGRGLREPCVCGKQVC